MLHRWLFFACLVPLCGQSLPPVVFVHGNGDDSSRWIPTIWLFESNGYPRHLLRAVRFTDPVARRLDSRPEPFRSSTVDQASELAAFVVRTLLETRTSKVALVGSSRGGLVIRNYLRNAGGAAVSSHAILCGAPNHGAFRLEEGFDSEFNANGAFLRQLNEGAEIVPGVRFLTLRSDRLDKYAQQNVGYDSPALDGAENLVLPGLDHREVAFHPSAFAAMFRFLVGRDPERLQVEPEIRPVFSGVITGFENGAPTNRPLGGVRLRIFAVDSATGERSGAALYDHTTDSSGQWGPWTASPDLSYEFALEKDGRRVSYFLSGLLRSSSLLNFRFVPAPSGQPGRLIVRRPRGYFSRGRDPLMVNGQPVSELPEGVPSSDTVTLTLGDGPARITLRNETVVARPSREPNETHLVELFWD